MDYVIGLAKNTRLAAAIAAELEQVRRAVRGDEAAGAGVRRAALSDAGDLEPRAAGGGQGRAPGQGPQPAVRGHVAVGRGSGGAAAVRAGLLRSRRDGEPDQGAAAAPVRRPDQRRDDAGQPGPAVLLVDRLRAAGGVAAAGPGGHGAGRGAVPDDPAEAAEDRGAGAGDGAEGVGEVVERQSVRRGVPAGAREPGPPAPLGPTVLRWVRRSSVEGHEEARALGPRIAVRASAEEMDRERTASRGREALGPSVGADPRHPGGRSHGRDGQEPSIPAVGGE